MLRAGAIPIDTPLTKPAAPGDDDGFAAIYHQLADTVYARLTRRPALTTRF